MKKNDHYYGVADRYRWEAEGPFDQKGYLQVNKRVFENYQDQYLDRLPENKEARILDVGCGWGYFLCFLKQKGYKNIEGVEIGAPQVEISKKYGIDNIHHILDLEEFLNAKKDYYDVITLNQVIEHFPKDKTIEYLQAVRGALKKGGIVILTTPNMSFFSAPISRYISFTHELGFTEWSLRHVLEFSGFDKSDIKIDGDVIKFKFRIKRILWIILRSIFLKMWSCCYLIVLGQTDRPKIVSKNLIAVAKKG